VTAPAPLMRSRRDATRGGGGKKANAVARLARRVDERGRKAGDVAEKFRETRGPPSDAPGEPCGRGSSEDVDDVRKREGRVP